MDRLLRDKHYLRVSQKDIKVKDSLWGKEKRRSKMGGEQYSTGTGVPAPEPVLYILLISISFYVLCCVYLYILIYDPQINNLLTYLLTEM